MTCCYQHEVLILAESTERENYKL